jgi:hypothetical protein
MNWRNTRARAHAEREREREREREKEKKRGELCIRGKKRRKKDRFGLQRGVVVLRNGKTVRLER